MTREQVEQAKIILKAIDELQEHLEELRKRDDSGGSFSSTVYFTVGSASKGPVRLDPAFMVDASDLAAVSVLHRYMDHVQVKIQKLEKKLKDI